MRIQGEPSGPGVRVATPLGARRPGRGRFCGSPAARNPGDGHGFDRLADGSAASMH